MTDPKDTLPEDVKDSDVGETGNPDDPIVDDTSPETEDGGEPENVQYSQLGNGTPVPEEPELPSGDDRISELGGEG